MTGSQFGVQHNGVVFALFGNISILFLSIRYAHSTSVLMFLVKVFSKESEIIKRKKKETSEN